MTRGFQWLRNVGSGYADSLAGGLIFVFLTPIFIDSLGLEIYGAWVISHTIMFYLRFLDLGFGEAQVRLHARYAALNRDALLQKLVATVMVSLTAAGMLAAVLGIAIAFGPLHSWFDISTRLEGDLRTVLVLLAINMLLALPGSVLTRFHEGAQRFDLRNTVSIGLRVLTAGAQLILLYQGHGIVALAAVELAATCLNLVCNAMLISKLAAGLLSTGARFHRSIWRRIRHFALWTSIDDLVAEGTAHLDKILIAVSLPLALLTSYSLCLTLASVLSLAVRPLVDTFFPLAAEMNAQRQVLSCGACLF